MQRLDYALETSARRRAAVAATHPKATAPASATITPDQLMKAMLNTMSSGTATPDAAQ